MKRLAQWVIAFLVVSSVLGCASGKVQFGPRHEEVLVYPYAYDHTYLNVFNALTGFQDWEIEMTDKEQGILRVRNVNYSGLDDADQRTVVFILKRISRTETSVEVDKDYQRVVGVGDLLKAIDRQMNRKATKA